MQTGLEEVRNLFDADIVLVLSPCRPAIACCQIEYLAVSNEVSVHIRQGDQLEVRKEELANLFSHLLAKEAIIDCTTDSDQCKIPEFLRAAGITSLLATALDVPQDKSFALIIASQRSTLLDKGNKELFQLTAVRLADRYRAEQCQESIQRDFAKRQKVDAQLIRSRQRFQAWFEQSSIALWLLDLTLLFDTFKQRKKEYASAGFALFTKQEDFTTDLFATVVTEAMNSAAAALMAAEPDQIPHPFQKDLFSDHTQAALMSVVTAISQGSAHVTVDTQYKTLHNEILDVMLSADVLPGSKGKKVLISLTDVTSLKLTEQNLFESREKYRLFLETAKDAVFLADFTTGRILEANRQAGILLGRPVSELVGMHHSQLHPADEKKFYEQVFTSGKSTEESLGSHSVFVLHSSGKKIPVEISASTTEIDGRQYILGIFHDVSKRLEMEEKRRLLAAVVEQTADSVMITDTHGHIEYVNPAFEATSGYNFEEIRGKTPRILKSGRMKSYQYKLLWQQITQGRPWSGILVNKKKDGSLFEEENTITPVTDETGQIHHFVAVKRDVTQQLQQEQQVRRAQKMQAIGTLAGGVAHDFNNILTALMGFAELSLDRAKEDTILHDNLQEIISASSRAGKLINQILTFSRQSEKQVASMCLSIIVKEVLTLLRATLPANIDIHLGKSCDAMVQVDPTQIHQVILNLCTNAYQALPPEGGEIIVSLERKYVGSFEGVRLGHLPHGDYVLLIVEDNGNGIPQEHLNRIFEPYFTTKQQQEGTGLGLSVVHGIVNDHKGTVVVESQPRIGSVFTVYLPEISGEQTTELESHSEIVEGKGHVLVVDDEQQIVDYMVQVLEKAGYVTHGFHASKEAIVAVTKGYRKFDLVITDMAMPEITGLELFRQVRDHDPSIPVLLCTGYSEHISEDLAYEEGLDGYLEKPYTPEQLTAEVKRILLTVGKTE